MKTHTILIVEDNPITRKMVRVTLETAGYAVLEAPDGRTALELMAKRPPDLVLQDILLPDVDGFDLINQLRALPGAAEIPILGFSGFLSRLEQAKTLQGGFTDFVFKPVAPSRLLQVIQGHLVPTNRISEKPGKGRQVLLADDDPIQRRLMKAQLEQVGFRVAVAEDGADALEQARRSPPDIIATDLLMPRLDGFRLCLAVRQDPALARVPVVVFSSAFDDEADHRLAQSVGASRLVFRTPDGDNLAAGLLAALSQELLPVPADPVQLPTEEYLHRIIRQLERQAAANVRLTTRTALLEAELAVLTGIPEMLMATPVLKSTLNDLIQRCFDAAGISKAITYLVGSDGRFSPAAHLGYPDSDEGALAEFFGHADLLRRALREAEPVLVPSPTVPGDQSESLLATAGAKTMLISPLIMGAERLGVLVMVSVHRELGEEWLSFAKAVGGQFAQAVGLARAHARLAASEQQIRDLVQGLDAIVWEADAAPLKFSFVSQRAEEVLGYPIWQWLTKEDFWAARIHPDDRERIVALYRAAGTEGRDFEAEYRILAADSRVVWFRDRVRAVRHADGTSRQLRGIMLDITERKRSEEEADRQRREAEAFARLVRDLATSLELDPILERVVAQAKALGSADLAFLTLVEADGQTLTIRAETGARSGALQGLTVQRSRGMAGTVLETGELLDTADYLQDARFPHSEEADAVARAEGTVAQAAVPITYGESTLGVLLVARRTPRPFTLADLQVITRLADAASLACYHALLYEQATSRAATLERLWQVGQALSRPLALPQTLDQIVHAARELLRADYALLTLWRAAAEHLTLAAQAGTQSLALNRVFPLGEGGVGTVAATRQSLIVNDYQAFPPRLPELATLTAIVVVPLLVEERLIGALSVGTTQRGRTFTAEDRQLLELLAHPAAIALENTRLYEALKQEALQLEARVEDRTQALQTANARLEEAMRQVENASRHKSEFLANMSHELRTPLNSIIGFSEFLREQSVGSLTAKQARYLGHIHQSGKHLLHLINDILDLSKVEAGKFVLEPESVDVAATLEDILVIARGLAHEKAQRVEAQIAPELPPLQADPVRFKQICFNLLSNAIKFTPERGRITLVARRASAGGELLEIRVTDTGIGIKAEDLPRLFQEFVQLEAAAAKRYEGTGLGLALTKKLVELHGGTIAVASEGPGRGATFTVRLPLARPGSAQQGEKWEYASPDGSGRG